VHYNIYFLLGNIIGVPLIGVQRRRHPRDSTHVSVYVCIFYISTLLRRKKKWPFGLSPLVEEKVSIYTCVCIFFFFCSSVRWTVKIRINLRIKKLWFTTENSSTKKNWNRGAALWKMQCAQHICRIFVFS